jgi:hypothetical protein
MPKHGQIGIGRRNIVHAQDPSGLTCRSKLERTAINPKENSSTRTTSRGRRGVDIQVQAIFRLGWGRIIEDRLSKL